MSNDPIPSLYNFVPLAEQVFFPDWADQVSMDVPFRDGVSGSLTVRVTAKTPIYIRAGGDRANPSYTDFYRAAGLGTPYAIPGSSLKGMLRGVVEIASFGKIVGTRGATERVSNHKYAVRDLQNPELYTKKITIPEKGGFKPLVKAGWLSEDGEGRWTLTFCEFARVEQTILEEYFNKKGVLARRQSAREKYDHILPHTRVNFHCEPEKAHPHSKGKKLVYSKVLSIGNGQEGIVVLTGQPSPRTGDPGRKHMEFIFFNKAQQAMDVPDKVKKEFDFAHTELGENRKPNKEWAFWKGFLKRGAEVPVFVLMDHQHISSMGLAMMFRLPYLNSIHDAIAHTSNDHLEGPRRDLAELMFGHVEDTDGLRGRVSVEALIAEGDPQVMDCVNTVLSGPKPTYYPNYIQQTFKEDDEDGTVQGGTYQTLMDDSAKIRGWKRYIRQADGTKPDPPSPPSLDVATSFRPLPAGTTFTGTIHVHNLKPQELGALIWAIEWGGDRNLRHALGMGKPYGYGSVTLEVVESPLCWCDPARQDPVELRNCRQEFETCMTEWWGAFSSKKTWTQSPQLRALRILADPAAEWPQDLRYPQLGNGPKNNEFVIQKKLTHALFDPLRVNPGSKGTKEIPQDQEPPPIPPPVPMGPEDIFLTELDNMSLKEIPKRLKALNLKPESVPPEKRLLIYQKMKKKPNAMSDFRTKEILAQWKP